MRRCRCRQRREFFSRGYEIKLGAVLLWFSRVSSYKRRGFGFIAAHSRMRYGCLFFPKTELKQLACMSCHIPTPWKLSSAALPPPSPASPFVIWFLCACFRAIRSSSEDMPPPMFASACHETGADSANVVSPNRSTAKMPMASNEPNRKGGTAQSPLDEACVIFVCVLVLAVLSPPLVSRKLFQSLKLDPDGGRRPAQ